MTKPARVLVVDDNPVIRAALSGVIRQNKQFVVIGEAGSGEGALAAIKSTKPHVMCLDVLMPRMDGLAVLERVRDEHPDLRVVIITGHATSDVVQKALACGARGFVVKPCDAQKVLSALDNALV